MMTMLVATLGLLPAGTLAWDWLRFATAVCIVIVGGLGGRTAHGHFLAAYFVCGGSRKSEGDLLPASKATTLK